MISENVFRHPRWAKKLFEEVHTKWVDILYREFFSKQQRLRHRQKVIQWYNAIERGRPKWCSTRFPRSKNVAFVVQYDEALSMCPSNLFRGLRRSQLEELLDCVQRCYSSCNFPSSRRESSGGYSDLTVRKKKLRAFAEDPNVMTLFGPDVLSVVCEMVQTSGPESLRSAVYENETTNPCEWWVEPEEARVLCRDLKNFLSQEERASEGCQLCHSIIEKLEWYDTLVAEHSGRTAKKRKTGKDEETEEPLAIGPFIWVSLGTRGAKKDILYQIPELRAELTAFFRWTSRVIPLREAAKEEKQFSTSLALFNKQKQEVVREKIHNTYRNWVIVKSGEGTITAVGQKRKIPSQGELLLKGESATDAVVCSKLQSLGLEDQGLSLRPHPPEEEDPDENEEDARFLTEVENAIEVISTQVQRETEQTRTIAGAGHITLTKGASDRIFSDTRWLCDDAIRVYLYGVIVGEAIRKGLTHVAFISPPQGLSLIKRSRGHGLLPQDVITKKGGLIVAVENIGGNHWICIYAYLKKGDPTILIFNSLGSSDTSDDEYFGYQYARKIGKLFNIEVWQDGTPSIQFPADWPRQTDPYNCGPLSLKAAELAIHVSPDKIPEDANLLLTTNDVFRPLMEAADPGEFCRQAMQEKMKRWIRENARPLV